MKICRYKQRNGCYDRLRTITLSAEQKIARGVELDIGDHAGDELQKDEKREVRLDFVACFYHGVGHAFEDGGVATGVHCWHGHVVQEGELLHCEGLVQVLSLDVLPDGLVADRRAVLFGGAEEHSGSVVVLVVDDVHFVVTEVLLVLLLELGLSALQDDDVLVFFLLYHLFLHFVLSYLLFQVPVESSFAEVVLEQEVLLVLRQVF